jgi:hypothetical protein
VTREELFVVLQDMCANAYWYGEDTGDYDMVDIKNQYWFYRHSGAIAMDGCKADSAVTSINVTTTEPLPDVVLVNGVEYRREQVSGRGDLRPILDWQLEECEE